MKIGVSSYSLQRALKANSLDFPGAVRWIAENGGDHMEVVPLHVDLTAEPDIVKAIVAQARESKIDLSSYTIGANFITETEDAFEEEVCRVLKHVEVGAALGVTRMRHDAGWRPIPETTLENFERDLPRLVEACQRVADHARKYGIVTSVENHGYHVQAHERVQRLVHAVNRENFRTTIDIGNFLCADEDPLAAVKANLPYASMVHFKDFYRRKPGSDVGEGWFESRAGYKLRGAIIGNGDIDIPAVARIVKASGYNGYVSVEFEGAEDCFTGARIGLENLRRYLA